MFFFFLFFLFIIVVIFVIVIIVLEQNLTKDNVDLNSGLVWYSGHLNNEHLSSGNI